MVILGIETTCDETGVGIVKDGREVLANVVASSINLHAKYGGIVPEVAAREQVRVIIPVIKEAVIKASEVGGWPHSPHLISKIDAIAVANGPGLIGSLLVGVETAKILALVWNKPLVPVNHLLAHEYANWLEQTTAADSRQLTLDFPLVALIVSGGHTDLILMTDHGEFRWLGSTRDDAAGEAFDKVARIIDLSYPGGPEIEKLAKKYNNKQDKFSLSAPMMTGENFDFSFSGIKTAVFNLSKKYKLTDADKTEIAYKFQEAVCAVLVKKTLRAALQYKAKSIAVGGGVAANSQLRYRMSEVGKKNKIKIFFPKKELSIDNGAMIAGCAYFLYKKAAPLLVATNPSLHF